MADFVPLGTVAVVIGIFSSIIKRSVKTVAQIAANILAGNAGNTQIAQQAQALQMQYNTLSEIFEQASSYQQELMDLYKKGCFNSQVTFFGCSFAETLAWIAALGLGISFAVDKQESEQIIQY